MYAVSELTFKFSPLVKRVQYAKTKSDCIAKEDGTYAPKEKRKKQEEKGNSRCMLQLSCA
jgi:hypothetical protein